MHFASGIKPGRRSFQMHHGLNMVVSKPDDSVLLRKTLAIVLVCGVL